MSKKCDCSCGFCKPEPGKRYSAKYGYDLDLVKEVNCLGCGKPIGDEEYTESTGWARFGQMFFYHLRCDPDRSKAQIKLWRDENE